jgi:hypothetical protein
VHAGDINYDLMAPAIIESDAAEIILNIQLSQSAPKDKSKCVLIMLVIVAAIYIHAPVCHPPTHPSIRRQPKRWINIFRGANSKIIALSQTGV